MSRTYRNRPDEPYIQFTREEFDDIVERVRVMRTTINPPTKPKAPMVGKRPICFVHADSGYNAAFKKRIETYVTALREWHAYIDPRRYVNVVDRFKCYDDYVAYTLSIGRCDVKNQGRHAPHWYKRALYKTHKNRVKGQLKRMIDLDRYDGISFDITKRDADWYWW